MIIAHSELMRYSKCNHFDNVAKPAKKSVKKTVLPVDKHLGKRA